MLDFFRVAYAELFFGFQTAITNEPKGVTASINFKLYCCVVWSLENLFTGSLDDGFNCNFVVALHSKHNFCTR